jgi:two-component system copper resistance phosphate regulon response regulator CusR
MRILIVEDNEKIAKMIKSGLEKEGCAVDYLNDGQAALRRIEVNFMDYDLIILDLGLPGKGGMEILESMRTYNIETPVIILTAESGVKSKTDLLDLGADDYVVKPFEFEELLARIRAIMRRPKESLPLELKISDVILNPTTQTVTRNGKEVKLTLKEFRILEYMMRHPNQALKREDIISNIWDFDYDSFSNVLDVFVNKIRNKIDKGRPGNLIETVRGIGYKIKAL